MNISLKNAALLTCTKLLVSFSAYAQAIEVNEDSIEIGLVVAYTPDAMWEQAITEDGINYDLRNCDHIILTERRPYPHVCETERSSLNLYTTEACDGLISADRNHCIAELSMKNQILISVAELNKIYQMSGIGHIQFRLNYSYSTGEAYQARTPGPMQLTVPLVHQFLFAKPSIYSELIYFRNQGNDHIDSIHTVRKEHNGDIAILLTSGDFDQDNSLNFGGLAFKIGALEPHQAFTVLKADLMTSPHYVFAHEVTHLLGGHHDKRRSLILNIPQDPVASIGNDHAYAYMDPIKAYGTLMAYPQTACAESCRERFRAGAERDSCLEAANSCVTLPLISTNDPEINQLYPEFGKIGDDKRNNAAVIRKIAPRIARFSQELRQEVPNLDHRISIDFGHRWFLLDPMITTEAFWNNLTQYQAGAGLDNLVNQKGEDTGIQLELVQGFSGASRVHTMTWLMMSLGTAIMPAKAMADGFTAFNGNDLPMIRLSGLNPQRSYSFRLFGSRPDFDRVRQARYIVEGHNQKSGIQMVAANYGHFLTLTEIYPNELGEIWITVDPGLVSPGQAVSLNAWEFWED